MKKYAVACLSSLLAFVCVSEMTKRVAAQGKTAAAPGRAAASPATPEIDKEKIRAHVKFLASDLLEGRGTGQRGGDIAANNESQAETADIDAPIVFVGYGIKAPEYGWDDYKSVDLHGKVALLFVNEPSSDDPNFFKGKALTYYGRWTYKFEETARRGAVATLIIHRADLAS